MSNKTYILQLVSPLVAMASLRTCTLLVVIFLIQPMSYILVDISVSKELKYEKRDKFSSSIHSNSITDTPSWLIGDVWEYDGYLDVSSFVASSGASTSVDVVYGVLDRTVTDMYLLEIDNSSTLVYEVISQGTYQTNGAIDVEGQTGCLIANIEIFEIVLASDLSTYSQEAEIEVFVDPALFGICFPALRIDLAELTVKNTFNPPMEWYDFPLSVGESWNTNYSQSIEFSGTTNDLITIPIPENTTEDNSSSWEVVSRGYSGVSYTGCLQSYNITSYDRDGNMAGYRWYCPAIRGDIKTSLVQSFGFTLVNELVSYSPSTRQTIISIELETPLSPLDIETSAWINVTNNGQPVSGKILQFRYEKEEFFQNITTNQDGSAYVEFNSGESRDNSDGYNEYGSHGILAWIQSENIIGVETIVIDPEVFAVDLVTSSSGVTVSRNRGNNTLTLNPLIGFNAVSGDSLIFSIPVINRGVQTSPPSIIEIQAPDGTIINGQVPELNSLEEARVELNWTIPASQVFGNISLIFEVDPSEEISEDGNRSNNFGFFNLYIGSLPMAIMSLPPTILTMNELFIDGTNSSDPDGGSIICDFTIVADYGSSVFDEFTSLESDCTLEWIPQDDGIILISMTVIDQENDQSTISDTLMAINRPPILTIGSDNESVEVLSPVTFRVLNATDLDSNNPSSPVDILWKSNCAEGQVGITCTVVPTDEGEFKIEAVATDDDGETTTSNYSVNVTNIAPFNPLAEVWLGSMKLIPDNRGLYSIQEGDNFTLYGQASDSLNDINSLEHHWQPNAESFPNLNFTTVGEISTVSNFSYNYSGIKFAILTVTDDDGEETEPLTLLIQVVNFEPQILPIPQIPQISEDEEIEIVAEVVDSYNDMESLIYCFDLNPEIDSDEDGAAKNDCDINSNVLVHSWPDASTSPDFIIFHVSDNDGSTDFTEIEIDVVNTPPVALASVNALNPTEGDKIILSANGSIDSVNDMESLTFHWDLDISLDSDGDGNPSNDIDMMGRWIEASYDSEGLKQVKLTVIDESESHSVTMDINVATAPSMLIQHSTSIFGIIIVAIISLSGYIYYTRRMMTEDGKDMGNDELNVIDFDDTFSKDTNPDSLINNLPAAPDLLQEHDIIENKKEPDIATPDDNERLQNAGLDIEDIEALFE